MKIPGQVVVFRFPETDQSVGKLRPVEAADDLVVVVEQPQVRFDRGAYVLVRKMLGDAAAVRLVGELLSERRQVVLRDRILNVREQLGATPLEVSTPAQQIAGRAPLGRIDVGNRKGASAQ